MVSSSVRMAESGIATPRFPPLERFTFDIRDMAPLPAAATLLFVCCVIAITTPGRQPARGFAHAQVITTAAPHRRSRTRTIAPREPTAPTVLLSTQTDEFTDYELQNGAIFPPRGIVLYFFNDSFVDSASCRSLVPGFVRGQSWTPSLIGSVTIQQLPRRVGWTPAVPDATMTLRFKGIDSFQLPDPQADYVLQLPAACAQSGLSPNGVAFTIVRARRSQLGRIMSFVALLASTLSVVAALAGSMFCLFPAQQVAMLMSCTCGAVPLQEEGLVLSYTLVPMQLRLLSAGFLNLVVCNVLVVAMAATLDLIHFAWRLATAPAYRIAFSNMWAIKDSYHPTFAAFQARVILPPCFTFMVLVATSSGSLLNAVRSVLTSSIRAFQLGAGLMIVVNVLGIPLVALAMSRVKSLKFYAYSGSKLPKWLRPQGTWGPNITRLTIGYFVEDFRRRRKACCVLLLLNQFVVACVLGNRPTSTDGCKNVMATLIFFSLSFALVLYVLKPFRSRLLNVGHVLSVIFFAGVCGFFMANAGYYNSDQDHWTASATFIAATVLCAHIVAVTMAQLVISAWEGLAKKAQLTVCGEYSKIEYNQKMAQEMSRTERGDLGPETAGETADDNAIDDANNRDTIAEAAASRDESDATAHRLTVDEFAREMYIKMKEEFSNGLVEIVRPIEEETAPRNLAAYLMQDYEALPALTKQELVRAELQRDRHREERRRLVDPMVVPPSLRGEDGQSIILPGIGGVASVGTGTLTRRPPVSVKHLEVELKQRATESAPVALAGSRAHGGNAALFDAQRIVYGGPRTAITAEL